ncbi:universal stress protein [Natrinema salaciae]|uniref:Nucleotide-binding universal stress protein, UspA family n=1 Tax=Natrinema salaciae TaxID=1186196 RepID=A0A1H9P8A6_9EURY|nr:universal stress protein [Natrinema salaciae]SER44442.1 Nucleotide-binding universal stress protein, UspA family [Natrinema salaciae]
MYDRILVPVDRSDPATTALDHTLEIAGDHDATVTLLYVADTNKPSQTRVGTDVLDVLEREGDEIVEDAWERTVDSDVPVTTDVVQGATSDAIVDYAETKDVDLVAMGTHGRDGLERYVVGSVAERVVNTAPMPVLTVRAVDDVPSYPYESVLVPTDGSEHATVALQLGADVANRTGATLHLLSVLEDQLLGSIADETERENRAESLLTDAESTAIDTGVDDIVTTIESGSVPKQITAYADGTGIDLVVMGTHGRTGLDERFLGSVTERVIRTASVPVLTTNQSPESSDETLASGHSST